MLLVFLRHSSFMERISLYRFFTLINHRQCREIKSRTRNKFSTASHTFEKPFLAYVVHIISLLVQGKVGRCWFGQQSITLARKLLQNSGGSALGYGSAFGNNFIGPYKIHSILDKGAYKLTTIPKEPGKRAGVLKNPVNWSRLRRFVPQGDDEFFNPEVNVADDLQ